MPLLLRSSESHKPSTLNSPPTKTILSKKSMLNYKSSSTKTPPPLTNLLLKSTRILRREPAETTIDLKNKAPHPNFQREKFQDAKSELVEKLPTSTGEVMLIATSSEESLYTTSTRSSNLESLINGEERENARLPSISKLTVPNKRPSLMV